MDRLHSLRSAWMLPLVAASAALLLWLFVHRTSPPADDGHLTAQAAAPAQSYAASPGHSASAIVLRETPAWLPRLESRSREILTSYAPAYKAPESATREPLLVPAKSDTASQPSQEAGPALGGAGVVVPEPERLPGGTVETGEPIPPRLPTPLGHPVPAPELVSEPQLEPLPVSEPWQPKAPPEMPETETGQADASPNVLLMPSGDGLPRSRDLELIATESDARTRHAFELAGRGAYLSARAEFITALRMLSQALDTEEQSNVHSQALAAGMIALKEADELVPEGTSLEANLDLPGIISRHRTPVLKGADLSKLTSMTALQCYLTFAQEQLAAAVGREVAGSMTLRGLGKLYESMGDKKVSNIRAAKPKAMSFYQASLLACPENFLASNDLGVLLARSGRLGDAQIAMEHSLMIHQQATGWHNLATIYRQLGRADDARRASERCEEMRQAELARKSDPVRAGQRVQWIDSQTFAEMSPQQPNAPVSGLVPQPQVKQNSSPSAGTEGPHVANSPSRNRSAAR